MFNAFPYDEWGSEIVQFWTYAGQGTDNSTGTWIIVALGFVFMCWAFVRFVTLENGKLTHQANALRASGALNRPPDQPAPTSAS